MRRILALFVLLARPALAALPSVELEVPPSPVSAGPAYSASAAGLFGAAPPTSALTPALAAFPYRGASPSAAPAVDLAAPAAPAVAHAAAPIAAAAAEPTTPSLSPEAAPHPAPRADAARREDSAETSAQAASADAGRAFDGTAPLLDRLLARVTLEDGGNPAHRTELRRGFERMLESPTARALAERYAAEGPPSVVRFTRLPETQPTMEGGRAYFHGARAVTEWLDGLATVHLNEAYLASAPHYREQSLPTTIAHELFGHGSWYARAERENVLLVFHHHELNEINALLIDWLVDFELDHRFLGDHAWSYLRNPQGYVDSLKMRLPFYAKTFSNAELLRPVETLERRLTEARATIERLKTESRNQATWPGVIDHFVSDHGVPEDRFRNLRAEFAQDEAIRKDRLTSLDALIAEVDALLGNFKREADGASEKILQRFPSHPLFVELQRATDENLRHLLDLTARSGAAPGTEAPAFARERHDYWRGQIDFPELQKMYQQDRRTHPSHWYWR